MAASDAIPVPRKNAAYRFYFAIRKPSDSTLITTWAGQDSEVSLDGGSFADCTNEATEIGTSGCGYIELTSSEMNADCVVLKISVTNSGAVPLVFVLYPESAGDYRIDTTDITAIKAKTDSLPSDPADASDIAAAFSTVNSTLSTIASYIDTEISNIQSRLPTSLVSGRMDVSVGAMAANVVTASAIATDAISEIRNGTSSITISRSGQTDVTYTEVRS